MNFVDRWRNYLKPKIGSTATINIELNDSDSGTSMMNAPHKPDEIRDHEWGGLGVSVLTEGVCINDEN